MVSKHILIGGRVQGVGFRFHTLNKAQGLGISGWVRNLKDGRVEIFATADSKLLEEFIKWLSVGPPRAQVNQIAIRAENSHYEEKSFTIRDDGGT